MLLKIMGLMDLLAAMIAVFVHIGFLPGNALTIFIAYLAIKGAIFIKSATSVLDLACALYLIVLALGLKTFLVYLVALYLFQKAVFSFSS